MLRKEPDVSTHSDTAPGSVMQGLIFLVGSVRSGSTLLRLMLGSHPEIAANPEFGFAVDAMGPDGPPPLAEYYDYLSRDRPFSLYDFEIDRSLDYPRLVDSFLRQRMAREGKPVVTATVHHHFDRILEIWPDARFVYLLRDGRDVAHSVIQMGWAGNSWCACDRWIEAERLARTLKERLGADRWLEVRYEDLVCDTEPTLERICGFFGVEASPAMFDYTEKTGYARPDAGLAEQWRNRKSSRDIQLAEARIGRQLAARGYPLSELPPLSVGPLAASWHRVHDRVVRLRTRIRRFGLWLVGLDAVARRVGARALTRITQRRMDEIVNRTLRE